MGNTRDPNRKSVIFSSNGCAEGGLCDGSAVSLWQNGATGPLGVRVRVGDNGHVTHSIIRFPLAINHPEIKECLFHVVKKYGVDEFALKSEACNGYYVGVKDGKLKLLDSYYPWNFENIPTAPWKEAMVNMIAACGRRGLVLRIKREGFYRIEDWGAWRENGVTNQSTAGGPNCEIYEDQNTFLESNVSNFADEICSFDQRSKGQHTSLPPLSIPCYKNVDKENMPLPGANCQTLVSGYKGHGDIIQEEMRSQSTFEQPYTASRGVSEGATCIEIDSNMPDMLHVAEDSSVICRMDGGQCEVQRQHLGYISLYEKVQTIEREIVRLKTLMGGQGRDRIGWLLLGFFAGLCVAFAIFKFQ